jgi:hypothetical protein
VSGCACGGSGLQHTAWKVLGSVGDADSPARRVADAIVRLELYRGAGLREDALSQSADAARLGKEVRQVLFDDSIERKAEGDIRALFSRISQIRKLVNQVAERKTNRRALLLAQTANVEAREEMDTVQLHLVLARLNAVADQIRALHDDFLEFSPVATEEPLTLSGCDASRSRFEPSYPRRATPHLGGPSGGTSDAASCI